MSEAAAIERVSAEDLVGASVRWRGVRLGRVVDMLLDSDVRRAMGFEVDCGNDERRFLALAACEVAAGGLALESAHALVDVAGLSFYREHSRSLLTLLGSRVHRNGVAAGVIEDVFLWRDGEVERVVVRRDDGSHVSFPPPELEWRTHD